MKPTDKYLHVDGIFTAFTITQDADFYYKGESHNFWEMVYVSEGQVGIMADSKVYYLGKGDIIFHKPNEFHQIWASNNTSPTYSVISFLLSGSGIKHFEMLTLKANEEQIKILDKLIHYMQSNSPNETEKDDFSGNIEPNFSCFVFLFDYLLCTMVKNSKCLSETKDGNAVVFEKVIKYMNKNIERSIPISEFADVANVSISTLKRIFLSYSSLGVHNYFTLLKIRKAKEMLRHGMSVCYVSQQLGFSNQNYFSAAFKRIVGCPPSKYK